MGVVLETVVSKTCPYRTANTASDDPTRTRASLLLPLSDGRRSIEELGLLQFQGLGQFVVNDALPGKRTVDRTRHVWRVIFGRRGVSSRDCRVRLSVITAEAELQDERLHVSGDLPILQHKLAGRRPEGRGDSVHPAIEGCGVKPEFGYPVCDQRSFPVAACARKFQSNLAPRSQTA